MINRWKRFDIHVKTMDGVTQQTLLGAAITLVSVIVIIMLVVSEFSIYFTKDVVSRMVADSTVGVEAVKLDFDFEFLKITCDKLTFSQEVTRGTLHTHEAESITKQTTYSTDGSRTEGCWIKGSIVTDKVGGNFRFNAIPDVPMPSQQQLGGGFIIGGMQFMNDPAAAGGPPFVAPILDHKINHIMFLPADGNAPTNEDVPGIDTHALNGITTSPQFNTGLYHYSIQVVPTHYHPLKGSSLSSSSSSVSNSNSGPGSGGSNNNRMKHSNQYSVTERQVDSELMFQGVSIGGQHFKELGVVFTYDFYPVMLGE